MKHSALVVISVVLIMGFAVARADVTIPSTRAGESASVASLGCQPNCPFQESNSAGGVIATYGGATAQATTSIGTDPQVTARATSVTGTRVEAGGSVQYSFAFVPNGNAGSPPPLMFNGLPYLPFSFTSIFSYQSTQQGQSSGAGISDTGYNPGLLSSIDLSTPNTNACATGCNGSSTNFYGEPSTPIRISVGAECNLQGIGSCYANVDPVVKIGTAYAPYYTVQYNPDLTSSVPEPSTASLLLIAFAGLAMAGTRREFRARWFPAG